MHPDALAARRRYWTRPDAYRFAPPGTPEAQMPGWLDPSATRVRLKEAQEEEARAEFEAELAELRASHERAKELLAEVKYELAWRRFLRKYRPDQPRVAAGNPDGGQWTKEGGGNAGKDRAVDSPGEEVTPTPSGVILSDASPDPIRPGAQYAQARVEIDPQVLTGDERIDRTTIALTKRLANVVDALGVLPVQSGRAYGRLVHETLKWSLRIYPIPGVKVEPTLGGTGRYGSDGSVRPDISLENEVGDTLAYYDFKTGGATVSSRYADKVRSAGGGSWVPVIQLSVTSGSRIKSCKHPRFD